MFPTKNENNIVEDLLSLKEILNNLNEKTLVFFRFKAIIKKTSIAKEIVDTLNQIADENYTELTDILN